MMDSTGFYNDALSDAHPGAYDHEGNDLMSLSDRINDAENKTGPDNNNLNSDQYTSMVKGLIKKGFAEKRLK